MIAEAPRPVAPAPVPQAQEYRPLRQQPQNPLISQAPAPYTAPQIAERPVYEAPRVAAPLPTPIAPQAPRPVTPQAEPQDGGQVTLTMVPILILCLGFLCFALLLLYYFSQQLVFLLRLKIVALRPRPLMPSL